MGPQSRDNDSDSTLVASAGAPQPSRLQQPRAKGRRDSLRRSPVSDTSSAATVASASLDGRTSSPRRRGDEEKFSALLAFKEQAAAVASTSPPPQSRDDVSDVAMEASEVSSAASAVKIRDLAELKSLRQPPAVVKDLVEAIAALFGLVETGWTALKKRLDSA